MSTRWQVSVLFVNCSVKNIVKLWWQILRLLSEDNWQDNISTTKIRHMFTLKNFKFHYHKLLGPFLHNHCVWRTPPSGVEGIELPWSSESKRHLCVVSFRRVPSARKKRNSIAHQGVPRGGSEKRHLFGLTLLCIGSLNKCHLRAGAKGSSEGTLHKIAFPKRSLWKWHLDALNWRRKHHWEWRSAFLLKRLFQLVRF